MKIVIIGPPKSGKTTLAHHLGVELQIANLYHTDSLMSMEWSEASEAASHWLDNPAPWIIEGTAAPRALRKWLRRNPGKRLDVQIVTLRRTYQELRLGQQSMAKGIETIMNEITPDLRQRGAVFVTNPTEARAH